MKHLSSADWAKTRGLTEQEVNRYFEELGYLAPDTTKPNRKKSRWILTEAGEKHVIKKGILFRQQLLWSIDAFFEVIKLHGKRTHQYYYCDGCSSYLRTQEGFEMTLPKWTCTKCGHENVLNDEETDDSKEGNKNG